MKFTSKRGRPKTNYNIGFDKGTKELQNKRKNGLTQEPIDIIFNKNLISEEEYNAANKLRWLHSLKFGVPHLSANNPGNINGRDLKKIDLIWLSKKEKLYESAIEILKSIGCFQIIYNICIFLEKPQFLLKIRNDLIKQTYIELEKLKIGLNELSKFFQLKSIN